MFSSSNSLYCLLAYKAYKKKVTDEMITEYLKVKLIEEFICEKEEGCVWCHDT